MKWLFRAAFSLVVLVVLAVVALVLVPAEKVAEIATDKLEEVTGRSVTIGGEVRATIWPRLGVRAEQIEIANAPWSDQGPMLQADLLEVGVNMSTLLGGDVAVETLVLDRAEVVIEIAADGRGNWELDLPSAGGGGGTATGGSAAKTPVITVDRAELRETNLTFIDHGADQTWRLRAIDAVAGLPQADGPVEMEASALFNGQAVTFAIRAADPLALVGGALSPLRVAVRSGGTTAMMDGQLDIDPPAFSGQFELETVDRGTILTALGLPKLDLPRGLGREKVAMSGSATLTSEGTAHLRDFALTLGPNTVKGAIDVDPTGDRPMVKANLQATALDLTALSREGQGGETALVTDTGWGRETIDVSPLFLADAEVTFTSGPITLGDAKLDTVSARIFNESGRMVVTLDPVTGYGGKITGDIVVNGRGGLSSRANLDLEGLQMLPFLTEFADFDRLLGQADLSVRLLGVGDTAQALVESLGGTVDFSVGQGELLGLDIPGMIRTLDLSYRGEGQKTVFDGITASLDIANGVATSRDLKLDAPLLAATGAGTIALGPQTLDYRILPTLRRNRDSEGVTVPILVTGAWSNPRIRPDLEFLARQRFEAERAEAEARARAEAEDARRRAEEAAKAKLAAELEVQAEVLDSRESIEDAIKERVEEQLLDLLLNR